MRTRFITAFLAGMLLHAVATAPAAALQPGVVSPPIAPLSGIGVTPPQLVIFPTKTGSTTSVIPGLFLQPAILVFLSAGATLTYTVEVTGDDTTDPNYNPATGNWQPMTGMSGLTASTAQTLGAAVTALRLRVTAYTNGTATLQFVQAN